MGELCMWEIGSIWEISVLFSQFHCEPKIVLKKFNKVLKYKIVIIIS